MGAVAIAAAVIALSAVATGAREGIQPTAQAATEPAEQTLKKTMWGPTSVDGRSLFPTYRDLGVGIFAVQARWDQIAHTVRPADPDDPDDPAYKWPQYLTDTIAEAESYGMQVEILIIGTPPWANDGMPWQWVPKEPSDIGDFATAISRHYPSVNLWQIWGEPNRKPNFEPFTPAKRPTGPLNERQAEAPELYAQMLDSAYGALKEVDRDNLVIGGNTFTAAGPADINTYQWIRYLRLPDGNRPRMDMWGHNPWGKSIPNLKDPPSPRGSVAFGDLRRLARTLDRYFDDGPPLKLYLSEWGVPTGFRDKDLFYKLSNREGKKWIKAAFRITRTWKRIYTLGWIHPLDSEKTSTGLLTPDGERKPVFRAYQAG